MLSYFNSAMAASAFAFAVFMSPALHAASASLIRAMALLEEGVLPPATRGA